MVHIDLTSQLIVIVVLQASPQRALRPAWVQVNAGRPCLGYIAYGILQEHVLPYSIEQ